MERLNRLDNVERLCAQAKVGLNKGIADDPGLIDHEGCRDRQNPALRAVKIRQVEPACLVAQQQLGSGVECQTKPQRRAVIDITQYVGGAGHDCLQRIAASTQLTGNHHQAPACPG